MIQRGLRFFVPFVFVSGLIAEITIYRAGWAEQPIRSDGVSYHVYLPAIVLHQSPRLNAVANEYFGGHFPVYTGIIEWPNTSWWLNPHPMGVAVLMLPFFLVAHALTLWSNLPPDGFSRYYQTAAAISGAAYGAAGLWLLQRLLLRVFRPGVALATLVSIAFGTNLFHYMTYDATYSHAYAFFLVAGLLWMTAAWHDAPTLRHSVLLGLVAGWLVIVRHTHAMLLIVPLLFGLGSRRTIAQHVTFLWEHRRRVLAAAAVGAVVVLSQVLLYRAVTGSWFVYGAYQTYSETFHFDNPDWLGVLFSVQKGVFFWSPLLLIACAGYAVMHAPARAYRLPSGIVLAVLTWVVASWHHFGGSYGHRAFTDVLPLLSLPLASAYTWAAARHWTFWSTTTVASLAIGLSVFQMLQYWWGLIPFNDTTWEQYRAVFLRLS